LTIDESHVIFLKVDFGIWNAELKSFILFKNMFHSAIRVLHSTINYRGG
jgi:hypothetical protein